MVPRLQTESRWILHLQWCCVERCDHIYHLSPPDHLSKGQRCRSILGRSNGDHKVGHRVSTSESSKTPNLGDEGPRQDEGHHSVLASLQHEAAQMTKPVHEGRWRSGSWWEEMMWGYVNGDWKRLLMNIAKETMMSSRLCQLECATEMEKEVTANEAGAGKIMRTLKYHLNPKARKMS